MSASIAPSSPFRGYRFSPEIISHAVWLYYRFALSHRDVEELLAERGIQVSYEAIRLWCRKFGPPLASDSVDGVRDAATSGFWTRWR